MCCFPLSFSTLTVKVMRDGDGDGRCQEEDGKWVPCPPGVASGTRLRNGKPLGQTLADIVQAPKPSTPPINPTSPRGMTAREDQLWRQPRQPSYEQWLDLAIDEGTLPPPPEPKDFATDREWTDEYNGWEKRSFALFQQRKREDEERRENEPQELTVQQQFPDMFDDEDEIRPEVLAQYLEKHRSKAADIAAKLIPNKLDVSKDAREAANAVRYGNWLDPDGESLAETMGRDADDFAAEFARDNPEPDLDDFYDDYEDTDEAEEAHSEALQDWMDERERYVNDSLIDQENEQEELSGNKEEVIATAFTHDRIVGKNGDIFSSEVQYVEDNYDGSFTITGNILAPNGAVAAQFYRVIGKDGPDRVYHDRLIVTPQYQNAGIASAFNAMNEVIYKEMGIDGIDVNGVSTRDGRWSGASHWPRNGYNWASSSAKQDFIRIVQRAVEAQRDDLFENAAEREIVRALMIRALAEPMWRDNGITAGDLVRWKGATKWFQEQSANLNFAREI